MTRTLDMDACSRRTANVNGALLKILVWTIKSPPTMQITLGRFERHSSDGTAAGGGTVDSVPGAVARQERGGGRCPEH